jgi:drug/metabolite transporter (DMT)-like permease
MTGSVRRRFMATNSNTIGVVSDSHTAKGILLMLAAVAVLSLMDAAMKQLAQTYPPMVVSCLRGLASIPVFLLVVTATGQWRRVVPVRWLAHFLRGGLSILMLWMFIYSLSELSLSTAYGIVLCAPLLITALSALVLRERVGQHRWFAVVFGLIGVGIILNPRGSEVATLAGFAALAAALCYAMVALMLRRLTSTESTLSIALSFVVMIGLGCGILAYPDWVTPVRAHWPLIAFLGLSGSAGQYLIIGAFRCAPPSLIAPFEYTALLWGVALDWFVWNTAPSARVLAGGSVVIATGLYLIYSERRASRSIPSPMPDSGI